MTHLIWIERIDGLWNAECACGATLAGFREEDRTHAEGFHFVNAAAERRRGAYYPSCGPVREDLAVCLYVEDALGRILATSRKDDHSAFGLPGGKVDPGETHLVALAREVREETGLNIVDPIHPIFEDVCVGTRSFLTRTFTASVTGTIHTSEPIVVDWVSKDVLLSGPFAEYNRKLFQKIGKLP